MTRKDLKTIFGEAFVTCLDRAMIELGNDKDGIEYIDRAQEIFRGAIDTLLAELEEENISH